MPGQVCGRALKKKKKKKMIGFTFVICYILVSFKNFRIKVPEDGVNDAEMM
jgi:hypothetical protein